MLRIFAGEENALRARLLAAAGSGRRTLVIVPEQYTLQTERDLMTGLDAPGFFDLEVLSPSRLTERVFAQAGADGLVRIDAIVERLGGYLSRNSEDGAFTTEILLPQA